MDRGYMGRVSENEHGEYDPNVAESTLESVLLEFSSLKTNAPSTDKYVKKCMSKMLEEDLLDIDVVRTCKNCHNNYTINRSYGSYDCKAHYGYSNFFEDRSGKWSCCGLNYDSEGCIESEHVPVESNSNYGSTSRIPTFKLPLGFVFAYGDCIKCDDSGAVIAIRSAVSKGSVRFVSRYIIDAIDRRKLDKIPVSVSYLNENAYEALFSSKNDGSSSPYDRKNEFHGFVKLRNVFPDRDVWVDLTNSFVNLQLMKV